MLGVGEGVAIIGLGAQLVGRLLGGKVEAQRVRELTIRYWSSALFELADNIRDVRAALSNLGTSPTIALRFAVIDAAIPELSRLDPSPGSLSRLGSASAMLRLVNELYLTDMRAAVRGASMSSGSPTNWRSIATAQLPGIERDYRVLRAALLEAADNAYDKKDWKAQAAELTPPDLDEAPAQSGDSRKGETTSEASS